MQSMTSAGVPIARTSKSKRRTNTRRGLRVERHRQGVAAGRIKERPKRASKDDDR